MRGAFIGVALLGLLTGCATLGLQSANVTVSRDHVLLLYADLKADIREVSALVARDCAAKTIPAETCARLDQLRERFRGTDALFQDAVLKQSKLGLSDLRGLLDLALQLGRLAGYPVPRP